MQINQPLNFITDDTNMSRSQFQTQKHLEICRTQSDLNLMPQANINSEIARSFANDLHIHVPIHL